MSFVVPGITHCEEHMNLIGLGYVCDECEKERNKKQIITNREWLFKKLLNMGDEELADFFDVRNILCEMIDTNCRDNGGNCEKCITNWLKAEHK